MDAAAASQEGGDASPAQAEPAAAAAAAHGDGSLEEDGAANGDGGSQSGASAMEVDEPGHTLSPRQQLRSPAAQRESPLRGRPKRPRASPAPDAPKLTAAVLASRDSLELARQQSEQLQRGNGHSPSSAQNPCSRTGAGAGHQGAEGVHPLNTLPTAAAWPGKGRPPSVRPGLPNGKVLAATTRSNQLSPEGLPSTSAGKLQAAAGSTQAAGAPLRAVVESPAPPAVEAPAKPGHTPYPGKKRKLAASAEEDTEAGLVEADVPARPPRPMPDARLVQEAEQLLVRMLSKGCMQCLCNMAAFVRQ